MPKCDVCDQDVFGDYKLCYLHRKYRAQLCGPYHETLYDLMWWKYTFLSTWDRSGWGWFPVYCSEFVEAAKQNAKVLDRIRIQIGECFHNSVDLVSYLPYVLKLAHKFGKADVGEMYQHLSAKLLALQNKLGAGLHPKIISSLVRKRIRGAVNNFYTRTITLDGDDDVELVPDNGPNVETQMIAKQFDNLKAEAVSKLINQLNDTQSRILANMFSNRPLTQKQLAKTIGVSQQAIQKAQATIFKKAKELGYGPM